MFSITTPFKDYNSEYIIVEIYLHNNCLCDLYIKNSPTKQILRSGKDVDFALMQNLISDLAYIDGVEDGGYLYLRDKYPQSLSKAILNIAAAAFIISHQLETTRDITINLSLKNGKYVATMTTGDKIINLDYSDV